MAESLDRPRNKISTGCLVGIVCGLVTPFVLLGGFILFSSLIGDVSISEVIGGFIFISAITFPFIGFQCVGIGAIVGIMNSMANGGIGRGIEWLFIAGIASAVSTWQWQIGEWDKVEFGVCGGMIGGIVGWMTWKLFQIEGEKASLTKQILLSYAIAICLIVIVFRTFETIMFLVTL
jgi:hypothetical protein